MPAVGAIQPAVGRGEGDLVAAVRRGDDGAFEELYSRYGGRIISYVFGMVGDHGRAEDIAQEVFISALRRMRATDRPIAFKPWIYEIAKNACIDEFRRNRRTKEVPLDTDDEAESPHRQLVSRGGSPDAALERRQQIDDLTGAFRGLSDNHHKILVLRELEGLSYSEIGRRLGMTRPVVESTLFRARKRLGQEYDDIASGRRCEQVQAVIDAGGAKAVRALGLREHRRLARHVAHCQPCRRHAWAAGVDDSVLKPQTLAGKIAALLPLPAFLRFRRHAAGGDAADASGSHFTSLQTASQNVAQLATPGSPVVSLGRVATVVAAAALAGGGVVAGIRSQAGKSGQHKPAITGHSIGGPAQVLRAHRTTVNGPSAGSKHGGKASAASGGNAASTHVATTSSSTTSSSGSQTVSHSSFSPTSSTSATSSGSGTSGSGSTGGSLSTPSLPKPTLPSSGVPKVGVPQPPSAGGADLNGVAQTVNSTVNNTVGQIGTALGTG